ncbi:Oligopeptide ABC transport system, permease protein AppB [Nitrospina gracilis 3/211]|uniref:Oligopeptide ABC transport system, permease protein AppB n=1 Tax=Nitrospina gracilis (strain 3/211) TaxID=1266370 RepID=M1Z2Y6_NITG3|nr:MULTISPECIES: ABC transporter permease [Nitrospina]MCF8722440.1 peptide/nickel transport system permease protein [Nitrospina sp. Nb-3]CCQ91865.1 Oligopeptide ABC transport system, permease protein AppB [Nitrospina gracilis 3/211]
MTAFIIRNIGQRIILLVFISIIAHTIVHLAPGEPSLVDPANPRMKAEDIQRIRDAFHLDDPMHVQYFYWMRDLFTGQLKSFKDNQPVLAKIWDRFLNSLPLFLVATLITWSIAFPMGIKAAIHRNSAFDRSTTFLSYALISIPGFFLAYILIIFVVQNLNVSVIGRQTFGFEDAGLLFKSMDYVWHLTLPSLMTAITGLAVLSRYVRSQMLEVINQDYIRTARAKGLDEDTVIYRHGLRNALLPFITMFGLMIPGLIGGSVIFETIFAWPGMGRLGYEAILARDFPVILTLNFIAAVLTLIGTLVSDILYAVADPRIKF